VVRHKFLLLTLVIVLSLSSGAKSTVEASQPTSGCSSADLLSGGCSVSGSINGGGVDLSGHEGGAGTSPGNSRGGGTSKNPTKPKPKPPDPVCTSLPEACQDIRIIGPGAPGNPALTINDLRNFPAVPGTDHMQPNGWMVVGLATNFYATVGSSGSGTELVDGTLLGHPATVRFTPVSWHWTYGDGTTATRSTPGSTWAAQGIPEFDPTATSHVYTADGTYFIDLSITFKAEYRYAGTTWTPVLGTITLPANRLEASAGDAKTVLVNRDCTQNPIGPGC
jgi:hypothetical protein